MKILQVHNYYQYSGGEDSVLKNEYELLSVNNNIVIQFFRYNAEIEKYSFSSKVKLFISASYSKKSYQEILELLKVEKPDIVHVHNTLPLVTPAVYYACDTANIPVVQTLHNYRLLCSNAYLFKGEKVCEECLGGSLYNSVKYSCYRDSKIQTFTIARSIEQNKKWSTWQNKIDNYIALTEFSKNKFIQGGLPKDKISIKPNFIYNDPGFNYNSQNHFLFAGRLDVTKGIEVLLKAIPKLERNINILIAGDGPLKREINNNNNVSYIGQLSKQQLLNQIKNSIATIFPSIWYETFGLLIIEAFASGKPVIASNLGAMAELIVDGKTGLLFEPGNSDDLAAKINWAQEHKYEMKQMGINARKEYEEKYTAEKNYIILMDIYNKAIESKNRKLLSNYFNQKPSKSSINFLAIPNINNPRLAISLHSYLLFKTGLTLHNTASAKNKIIKIIITIGFPLFKYININVISPKENVIELLNILKTAQQCKKLYLSSFYFGTTDNANRKITVQVCDSEVYVIGILKIPLAPKSEKYIANELDILNSLKQYDFQSFVYPVSSFLLRESKQIVVYQEDVFKDSKPIGNRISNILFEASCELSIKTVNKNNDEYFKELNQQINNLGLYSVLQKFIKQTADKIIEAKVPPVLIHGDYVKYNMKKKEGKLVLIDWEFARTGLPLFDLFHFVFQGNIKVKKKSIKESIAAVFTDSNTKIFDKYLNILEINRVLARQLFILYLYDNLLFEQNIKPGIDINGSQYFKALEMLRSES